jgi:acetyl-CoA/propionyl-CoA carboxylase biotin carboxyl carrier protein
MAKDAVVLARAAGYRSAGTVEFVVNERGDHYFLEVNARLQVEHPVTELVWAVDLVEQQLRVALGEKLSLDASPHGHAVEARVYAEDPAPGFLPSAGRLAHVHWPEGVRVDAGYEEGDNVPRHYDPLLAKVIAHSDDRAGALDLLASALAETEVLGVRTNVAFLRRLVSHPDMRAGRIDTGFVEREIGALVPESRAAPDEAYALAATALAAAARERRDPWTASGAWRIGGSSSTTIVLRQGDRERGVRLAGSGPFEYAGHRVAADDEPHRWIVDGRRAAAAVTTGGTVWVGQDGLAWELESGPRERDIERTALAEVAAPMPGVVIAAQAQPDRHVRRGELLFVVEAMKMELRVEAPADGTVTRVLARVGQQVERGQRLAEFEAEGA